MTRVSARPSVVTAPSEPAERLAALAWVIALPCAAVATALVVLLGPPLSHVLYPTPGSFTFLPNVAAFPEPVEDTRYVLSLSAPVLLVAGIALAARRPPPSSRAVALAAAAAQMLALGIVVACVVKQREPGWELSFFAGWQLLAGAAIAAALVYAARRGWLTRSLPLPRGTRLVVPLLLMLVAGAWFLSFVNTDASIWWAGDPYNSGYMYDESYAVLTGMTPLGDFTTQYASLWPYPIALFLFLVGPSLLAFTFAMWGLCVMTVVAIYGALRRATGHALAALGLTLPIMAISFFGAARNVHRPAAIFQFPLRNVIPFSVAYLLARQLDGAGRGWPLFVVAGLGLLNNFEWGIAALVGAVLALVVTSVRLDRRALARILGGAALGCIAAYALVALVTIVRAGTLPELQRTLDYARIYGMGGLALAPIPHVIGLPLVVYLTYVAALGLATVRAVTHAPNRVLTGMLVWSAIYGLGSGAYYVGESVPSGILTTFAPWSFALALLTVAAVQQLATHQTRRPSVAILAVLFGFGTVATFVLDPPASILPWKQVATIRHQPADPFFAREREVGTAMAAPPDAAFRNFIGSAPEPGGLSQLRPGAAVVLLWSTGHVIADQYGLRNVVPHVPEATFTVEQLDESLARLRAAGGSVVLVPDLTREVFALPLAERRFQILTRTGYRPAIAALTKEPGQIVDVHGLTKWVDERALSRR
jgi:hypothetical protein